MRASIAGWIVAGGLCSAGCTTVPVLQEDGIAVSAIVERVKCDLAMAIPDPEPPIPTGRYQWMKNWTAKVDLTLVTNEQGGITPSAVFLDPMKSVSIPGVGNFPRMFSLGAGGGLNTTAVRNETMSFTLSLEELRNKRYRGECNLPPGLDLYGHLGLEEWIDSALAPVDVGLLATGYHAAPGL